MHALGLVRVELHADVDNVASRRVAERAGYHLEGLSPKKMWHCGAHRDLALYALTG